MTTNTPHQAVNQRARKLTRTAYWQLLWECYAPALALGVLFICLYIIAAAFGLWQRIGDPWRLIALGVSVFFIVKSVLAAHRKLTPTKSQARRRVEHDSGLSHRPLDVLDDSPAFLDANDPAWQTHRASAQAQIKNARRSRLRPALAPLDKYYLRFAVPVLLLLGFMVGAGDNYERLRASLTPGWLHGISAKNAHYEAWIDPPQYTGRPPSYFKGQKKMHAPEGSEFVARITGVKTAPRLVLRSGKYVKRIKAKRLGPQSFEARAVLTRDTKASYRIGTHEQKWVLNVDKDTPPSVQFDQDPEAGKRDRLIFSYSLEDDYGVETLLLSIAQVEAPEITDQISLTLPGRSVRKATKEPGGVDLTKHKWAGKKVQGRLLAVDGKRQVGSTTMKEFIVPDKIFVEPLAKAVAEQRLLVLAGQELAYGPAPKSEKAKPENAPLFAYEDPAQTIERAPEPVQRTALLLEAVTDKPAGAFEDPAVYMGLRNIYRRLETSRKITDLDGIPEDLWAIALRSEFGLLGNALEDMQRAERALNNAMARRAPQREVDALFDRYNEAVDRYMEFLMIEAAKNAKKQAGDSEGGGGDGRDYQMEQIQALLDAIEEANRLGDTVAARKALAKLAQLLENIQIQMAQGGGGSGSGVGDSMSEELKEALEELNDVLGEQRRLRDETLDAGREQADQWDEQDGQDGQGEQDGQGGQDGQGDGNSGQSGGQPDGNALADQQAKIADMLKALEDAANAAGQSGDTKDSGEGDDKSAGAGGQQDPSGDQGGGGDDPNGKPGGGGADIKQALDAARRAMENSEQALGDGEFYQAGRAQSDAIDALRQAGEGLLEKEAKRLKKQNKGKGKGEGEGAADPFGREGGEGVGENNIDVPEISDQQRARELLEELRKRAGERERDETEREYIDRLLERF